MTEFFVDPAYKKGLGQLGLNSIDDVFNFQSGKNLIKNNLAPYRSRLEFQINSPATTLFLKRYNHPPLFVQFKNWFTAKKRISCAYAEFESAKNISEFGINTPKMVACGQKLGLLFEQRSFVIIEKIKDGESLEKKLPDCFSDSANADNLKQRKKFIEQLAVFIKKFHQTGYRHRDLYLCHIFHTKAGGFYLIDLARAFKPVLFNEIYRAKDLAQLHYSAPAGYFSKTDRLRFLKTYLGREKLLSSDKALIRQIKKKANRMARHDIKHGRAVPFKA
jgi:tRNA A-37 threonylcarbamoyl transferase component Bud32